MPIEVHGEADQVDDAEPGQAAYEALCAVSVDAPEVTLFGLLAAIQRGESWEKLPPLQRRLCVALEGELFDDEGGED